MAELPCLRLQSAKKNEQKLKKTCNSPDLLVRGTQILRNKDGSIKMVISRQDINPGSLQKADNYYGKPGDTTAHEFVEPYIAGEHSLNTGQAYGDSKADKAFYEHIHNETEMIAPQSGKFFQDFRDANGNEIFGDTIPAGGSGVIFVDDGVQGQQVIRSYP